MGMAPWDTIGPEDIHVRYKQDVNSIEYTGGRGQFIVKWGGPGIVSYIAKHFPLQNKIPASRTG